eukprot:scaffold2051_cov139-Skeletonema_marinoi.AAC.16
MRNRSEKWTWQIRSRHIYYTPSMRPLTNASRHTLFQSLTIHHPRPAPRGSGPLSSRDNYQRTYARLAPPSADDVVEVDRERAATQ